MSPPVRTAASSLVALSLCLAGAVVAPSGDAWAKDAKKATAKEQEEDTKCRAPMRLEMKNSVMQRNLLKRMRAKGWSKYIDKQLLAVALVDLSNVNRVYYAGVNDDVMLYSASLPKIAILLTVIEAVESGTLEWTHEFDKRLQNMVIASSNTDASWATDLVGLLAIERTMRDPRYCLYDNEFGGLWLGRAYRKGGATNKDPRFEITHGATARQAARFFAMLNHGKLVSPHWSFRMQGLMSPPAHHHKFVGALGKRPGVVFLARKSGTWSVFHSDSALIQHFDRRFVLVGLAETKAGESIMREVAILADDIIAEGAHRRGRKRPTVKK